MNYLPYIILGIFALILLVIAGFFALMAIKKITGKNKRPDEFTTESGDVDIIDKPGWFLYFRRRIAFYWNEFWYDRWLRVIRIREDRRMDYKNCIVTDKTIEFEDKSTYVINSKEIVRHQGKSYYFVVEGRGDFSPFDSTSAMTDKEFYAKYNSKRARELYLMTQYPVIQYLLYIGLIAVGLLLMVVLSDFGLINSVESQKLDTLIGGNP